MVVTGLTLYDSLGHHRVISEHYGASARLFDPLIAFSAFVIGAFISLMFQWGINVIHFEKVVKLLPVSDAAIMGVLFHKKKISEVNLSVEAGISKRMTLRVLSKMESRGIGSRTKIGDSSIVKSYVMCV